MIAFENITSISGSSNLATITWPGSPSSQMLLAVFGFENVNHASGPWITGTPGSTGLGRLLYKPPSADGGCGIEVWIAKRWEVGASTDFSFDTSRPYAALGAVYTGQYNDTDGSLTNSIRAHAEQPWTGDDPETPSIYAFVDEMLIAIAAIQLDAPYGTPTPPGWTERADKARADVQGNVEVTLADLPVTVEGFSGVVAWSVASASGSDKGATAIMAVRPEPTPPAVTSPSINIEYSTAI